VAVEHGLTETRNTSLNAIFVYNWRWTKWDF